MDKTLRIGVLGAFRGADFIRELQAVPKAKAVAVCDRNQSHLNHASQYFPKDMRVFGDYEAMLDSGLDAVILCNSFHEHAPAAIQALHKGIAVFSETLPASTLRECVELVEAVEKSKGYYALAENYPYFKTNLEMRRVYQSGVLGKVAYAEGEYVHPMNAEAARKYCPYPTHWRASLPKTYYLTHSLAPLMYITGLMPKKVIGKLAFPGDAQVLDNTPDAYAGVMLVEMEGGALFRVFGSASFGPMGNWYRLGCEKGGIESVRGSNDLVRFIVNPWQNTRDESRNAEECVYLPKVTEIDRRATHSWLRQDDFGHWGGDQRMISDFVDDLLFGRKPFMDVYRATALTATGILGWRSVLQDSAQIRIPDFRALSDRETARGDDRSPFYREGKEPDLPFTDRP